MKKHKQKHGGILVIGFCLLIAGTWWIWQKMLTPPTDAAKETPPVATSTTMGASPTNGLVTLMGDLFPGATSTLYLTIHDHAINGMAFQDGSMQAATVAGDGTSTTSSSFTVDGADDIDGNQSLHVMGTWSQDAQQFFATIQSASSSATSSLDRQTVFQVIPQAIPLTLHTIHDAWEHDPTKSCEVTLVYPEIADSATLPASVREKMNAAIERVVGITATSSVNDVVAGVMGDCRQEIADLVRQQATDTQDMPDQHAYDLDTEVSYNQGHILSVSLDLYSFTGGAHGSYVPTALTFDTRTGQLLSFRDLASSQMLPSLNIFIDQKILDKYHDELFDEAASELSNEVAHPEASSSQQAFQAFPAFQNFYVTPIGISVFFQQYELAPYSAGILDVLLTRQELQSKGYATTIYP